jgi:hypothetical protein
MNIELGTVTGTGIEFRAALYGTLHMVAHVVMVQREPRYAYKYIVICLAE